MISCNKKYSPNYGVTLVELLIVMGIIVAVMAIAIPVVRLVSDDGKVTSAAQEVRSFINAAANDAKLEGRSCVIFERNANAPDYCYRLFRGRIRGDYQGESYTSYAIRGADEEVETSPGAVHTFNVFFFYNADVSKFVPFEEFRLGDRNESYVIYRAFEATTRDSEIGSSSPVADQPTVKVFCQLSRVSSLFPGTSASRSELTAPVPESIFAPSISSYYMGSRNSWETPTVTLAVGRKWVGVPPAAPEPHDDPVLFTANGWRQNTIDGMYSTSRIFRFTVRQRPVIDELNYFELPDGIAINLAASGFGIGVSDGQLEGFSDTNRCQFAFIPTAEMSLNKPIDTSPVMQPDNLARSEFFPRIEFGGNGRIRQVYAMSEPMSRLVSDNSVAATARKFVSMPFVPASDMFLLLGEVDVDKRGAVTLPTTAVGVREVPSLLNSDFWMVTSTSNGKTQLFKAENSLINTNNWLRINESRGYIVGGVSEE